MVFHIFDLSGLEQAAFSGLEQAAFFHNLCQMKEALPLNSLFSYFETTPCYLIRDGLRSHSQAIRLKFRLEEMRL